MELPSPLISWVNPFPSRVINRAIFFWNALESHECASCLLSFLYFHWLFPLLARETSSGNRSIYKSTRERVDPKGLCGKWRLHLMGAWLQSFVVMIVEFAHAQHWDLIYWGTGSNVNSLNLRKGRPIMPNTNRTERGTWGFAVLMFFWCGEYNLNLRCCGDLKSYGARCLCFSRCGVRWNEIVCGAVVSCVIMWCGVP